MIRVTPTIFLSDSDLDEQFTRAPGPGGQNVNKVETAVQLRFDAAHCEALTENVRHRLGVLAGRRMTKDGVLIIEANRYRSQERNRADALDRLIDLIRTAATPQRKRRPTRPTLGSKQRRLETKKRRSTIKKLRTRAH